MADTSVSIQCPNCGAPLAFSPGKAKVVCEYCGTEFDVKAIEELYAKKEEMAAAAHRAKEARWDTAQAGSQWTEEEEKTLRALTCPTCGAQIVCDENTMATECVYCGNPTLVPSRFEGMLKPDFIIPFKKTKEEAVAALKEFYKGKFLLPKEFTAQNRLEAVQPMYVPFWLFDSRVKAEGLFRTENDMVYNTENAVITETSIYRCSRKGTMEFHRIPVDGSKKMDDTFMESIEPFDYSALVPFQSAYLTGFLADKYDVTAEDAAPRADRRMAKSAMMVLEDTVTGYMRCTPEDEVFEKEEGSVSYAMAPVWILTTRYKEKSYTFLMNGQTGKVAGTLPYDRPKSYCIFGAVTAVFAPAFYFLAQSIFG